MWVVEEKQGLKRTEPEAHLWERCSNYNRQLVLIEILPHFSGLCPTREVPRQRVNYSTDSGGENSTRSTAWCPWVASFILTRLLGQVPVLICKFLPAFITSAVPDLGVTTNSEALRLRPNFLFITYTSFDI